MRLGLGGLEREGFRHVHVLSSPEEADAVVLERQPLWCNLRQEKGPFDVIGDVHGCLDELRQLLTQLGYELAGDASNGGLTARHAAGRKAVDLVDRGPDVPGVLRLAMNMVESGTALAVPGNPPPAPALSAQQEHDTLLDLADVTGKRIVSTRLFRNLTIREENAAAALEVMSRFAADPRWIVYLPPTMSPSETSA